MPRRPALGSGHASRTPAPADHAVAAGGASRRGLGGGGDQPSRLRRRRLRRAVVPGAAGRFRAPADHPRVARLAAPLRARRRPDRLPAPGRERPSPGAPDPGRRGRGDVRHRSAARGVRVRVLPGRTTAGVHRPGAGGGPLRQPRRGGRRPRGRPAAELAVPPGQRAGLGARPARPAVRARRPGRVRRAAGHAEGPGRRGCRSGRAAPRRRSGRAAIDHRHHRPRAAVLHRGRCGGAGDRGPHPGTGEPDQRSVAGARRRIRRRPADLRFGRRERAGGHRRGRDLVRGGRPGPVRSRLRRGGTRRLPADRGSPRTRLERRHPRR